MALNDADNLKYHKAGCQILLKVHGKFFDRHKSVNGLSLNKFLDDIKEMFIFFNIVNNGNSRMIEILQKCGFQEEGEDTREVSLGIHLIARYTFSLICSARQTVLLFPVPRVDRTRYLPNKVVGLTKDRSFQSVSVSPSHAYLYNMNKIVLQLLFITLVNFHKILWVQRN